MTEKEKKNKRVAMIMSGSIHAALVILFLFLLAWREPNPPLPEYGIELNFGLDQQGSGEIQRTSPQRVSPSQEEDARPNTPPPAQVQEIKQAQVEQATPPTRQVTPVEQVKVESKAEAIRTETPPVTQTEASVKVEEKVSVTKTEEVVEKKVEEIATKTPPPKEVVKEAEAQKAAQTESKTTGTAAGGVKGTAETAAANNQGDDKNVTGDKGDPKGSIDARSLYGNQGGGGDGTSLDLAGWRWDIIPKPKDDSSESGKIVFEIKVDASGYIIGVRTLERSVSPAVEKIYRDEVYKLTFSKTSDNTRPAAVSTGRITFILRAR
jgi:periplasmic protein TonB